MRRSPQAERLAFAALLAGALCIAFAPIFVRESSLAPVATAFYRMLLALPLFALWASFERPPADSAEGRPSGRTTVLLLVGSGLFFAGDLAVWHWSIAYTSVENATLLANLAPVVVTAYAWVVLKERVSGRFLVGLVLALVGAGLLVRASFGAGGRHLLGDLLGVATAFFYAGYLLTVKQLRVFLPTARLMGASSLVSCIVLLGLSVAFRDALLPGSVRGWVVLIALAWLGQVAGQGLIAFGLKRLPASFSSVTLLVQPAAAGVLAWILLGESLSWWQALGGMAVLGGILLARDAVRPAPTRPPAPTPTAAGGVAGR